MLYTEEKLIENIIKITKYQTSAVIDCRTDCVGHETAVTRTNYTEILIIHTALRWIQYRTNTRLLQNFDADLKQKG